MNKKYSMPDSSGHFEKYGGKYVPETLIPALSLLEKEYYKLKIQFNMQRSFLAKITQL